MGSGKINQETVGFSRWNRTPTFKLLRGTQRQQRRSPPADPSLTQTAINRNKNEIRLGEGKPTEIQLLSGYGKTMDINKCYVQGVIRYHTRFL